MHSEVHTYDFVSLKRFFFHLSEATRRGAWRVLMGPCGVLPCSRRSKRIMILSHRPSGTSSSAGSNETKEEETWQQQETRPHDMEEDRREEGLEPNRETPRCLSRSAYFSLFSWSIDHNPWLGSRQLSPHTRLLLVVHLKLVQSLQLSVFGDRYQINEVWSPWWGRQESSLIIFRCAPCFCPPPP